MVVNEELSENVNIAHFHPKQNLASFGLNEELNPAIYVKHFVRESVCPLLFVPFGQKIFTHRGGGKHFVLVAVKETMMMFMIIWM